MSFFESKTGKTIMTFAYGIGAAIVIVGALFKILHLPGANQMLMLGMGTETLIFIISAFEPIPKEYHWENVYPELLGEHSQHVQPRIHQHMQPQHYNASPVNNLDISIDKSTTDSLKSGIKKLSDSIGQMTSLSSLVDATAELTGKIYDVSGAVNSVGESANTLSDAYYKGAQSIQYVNEQTKLGIDQIHSGYEYYRAQLESLGHTMGALNASYELYLQESKSMQGDYHNLHGELQQLIGNMNVSISETQKLGTQMAGLNNNVENLNSIYGSMLTAVNSVLNK
ncbi:MAG: gliding motility protein GldL [Prevotellaceae bacterium]|jgi:gliding motility-associated protein GldL|nr:gliding motility protein GldL [Prevotellaceae bacterium]